MLRLSILLFCLLLLPARANLGETVAQCVTRYGRPSGFAEATSKFPFGTVGFSAGPYTLIVFLSQGKEVGAKVGKRDQTAFTDAEMQNIMAADHGTSAWTTAPSPDPVCLRWSRDDKATAMYDKDKHILIFTSEEMASAMQVPPATPAPAK